MILIIKQNNAISAPKLKDGTEDYKSLPSITKFPSATDDPDQFFTKTQLDAALKNKTRGPAQQKQPNRKKAKAITVKLKDGTQKYKAPPSLTRFPDDI